MTIGFRTLSWTVLASAAALGCAVGAESDEELASQRDSLIFGQDDRVHLGAVTNPTHLAWAAAVGGLVSSNALSCSGGNCNLSPGTLTHGQISPEEWLPLCPNEPDLGRPQLPHCTAFLVGDDLVATAGHCVQTQAACESTSLVFGFAADANGDNAPSTVPASDVYTCTTLLGQVFTDEDWALFRVDRAVTGRTPLELRTSGAVTEGTPVLMIGHGLSSTLMLSGNAEVKQNLPDRPKFSATLDTFEGNSGSPVINATTGRVEGIAAWAPWPHWVATEVDGEACAAARVCSTDGCGALGWSEPTKVRYLVEAIDALDPSCTEETAIDLGGPGNDNTVSNDACLRVRDGYPNWWGTRTMQLQSASGGSFPVPYEWSNSCASSGGTGEFTGSWQSKNLTPTSSSCSTLIKLQGNGQGVITLRYFAG